METECKRILLLKGLQPLNDDQFSIVKSLLDRDLGLTPKMKKEYTKVKIADLMEKKFSGIACLVKLLELFKDMEELGDTIKILKNEKRKVMKKYNVQGPASTKRKQEASSTDESTSTTNKASGSVDDTLGSKKKKTQAINTKKSAMMQPTEIPGQLGQPSVTGPQSTGSFPQPPQMLPSTPGNSSSTKKKKTQAINTDISEMMKSTQIRGEPGQPSVAGALSTGSFPQPLQMPPSTPGSGSSTKKKKTQARKTEMSEMMQSTQIWGQPGQLPVTGIVSTGCFPQPLQLPSTPGSGSSTKKKKTQAINTGISEMMQSTQIRGQLGQPSVAGALSTGSFPQPLQMPPSTSGSGSSTKKMNMKTIKTEKTEMMHPSQEWGQPGQLPVTGAVSTGNFPQPPQPPSTPGSGSSTKKMNMKTIKTEKTEMIQPSPQWVPFGQLQGIDAVSIGSFPQHPQMLPPTAGSGSSTKKPRLRSVPTKASREEGLQEGPKEVMVLKATEPFAYDPTKEERKMFHATVVTESQFFQVKVFHATLKEKFIPKKVIAISNYFGRNGFLEVYNASCVSDVNADRKMEVSSRLIQNANATPKIKDLQLEEQEIFVSGTYQVYKKIVSSENITLYGIQDNTGMMDVLVYGRLTKVDCEEGDKLTLICFELSGIPRQLRSVTHSFIKVIKSRRNQT